MKWQTGIAILVVIAAMLAAGCTDEPQNNTVPSGTRLLSPGQVLYEIGDVTGTGQLGGALVSGTIDTITFTVGLAPDSKPIDMEKISIVYADAIRTESLIPVQGYRGDPPDGCWGILEVQDEIGKSNNRIEDKEKFVIRINPKAPLVPRQLITISVKPPSDPALTFRRVSPATIIKENNILAPV